MAGQTRPSAFAGSQSLEYQRAGRVHRQRLVHTASRSSPLAVAKLQAFARTELEGWLQKDTAAAESAEDTEVVDRQPA